MKASFLLWLMVIFLFAPANALAKSHNNLVIWFDAPAADWEREGLPIGNGAMGAVITGEIEKEIIQFNL